jgi:hypothetical protein
LQQYPICVLCLVYGDINKGSIADTCATQRTLIVDHIEPHRGNDNLMWDQDNWQTLCRFPCHDVVKQRHEKQGRGATEWYAMLRREMDAHGTAQLVRDMCHWLPAVLVGQLAPAGWGMGVER